MDFDQLRYYKTKEPSFFKIPESRLKGLKNDDENISEDELYRIYTEFTSNSDVKHIWEMAGGFIYQLDIIKNIALANRICDEIDLKLKEKEIIEESQKIFKGVKSILRTIKWTDKEIDAIIIRKKTIANPFVDRSSIKPVIGEGFIGPLGAIANLPLGKNLLFAIDRKGFTMTDAVNVFKSFAFVLAR